MSKELLYPSTVKNSVFIDFEGEGRKSGANPLPHMLGLYRTKPQKRRGDKYEVLFFKKDWVAPRNGYYKNASIVEFKIAIEKLIEEAKDREGKIIYWSNYELQVIKEHIPDLKGKFESVGYNLLPAIRTVKNRREWVLDDNSEKTLNNYLTKFGLSNYLVKEISTGAAELCRRIDHFSKKYKRWGSWPESKQKYVHDLLSYNRQDCKAVWRLSKKFANLNEHRRDK